MSFDAFDEGISLTRGSDRVTLKTEQNGTCLVVLRTREGKESEERIISEGPIRARWLLDLRVRELMADGFELEASLQAPVHLGEEAFSELLSEGETLAVEAGLVYADYLGQHGDPRGELIAIQHRLKGLARASNADDKLRLQRREFELLFRHRAHLLGDLGTSVISPEAQRYAIDRFEIEWKLGFFESVRYRSSAELRNVGTSGLSLRALLEMLAACPSARYLRHLEIGPVALEDAEDLGEALKECQFSGALRTLSFGGHFDDYDRLIPLPPQLLGGIPLSDFYPRLESVVLDGLLPKDTLGHPTATHLSMSGTALLAAAVQSIAGGRWPKLRQLVLGGPWDAPDVVLGCLGTESWPALEELRLEGLRDAARLSVELSHTPLARQLRTLRVVDSDLGDHGVELLVGVLPNFSNLETLDLTRNEIISRDTKHAFASQGLRVYLDPQGRSSRFEPTSRGY